MSRCLALALLSLACAAPNEAQPPPEPDGTVIWKDERGCSLSRMQVSETGVFWLCGTGDLFGYRKQGGEIELLSETATGFVVRENEIFIGGEVVERYRLDDLEGEPDLVADVFVARDPRYDELAIAGDWLYWTRPNLAPEPGEFGRKTTFCMAETGAAALVRRTLRAPSFG